MEFTCWIPPLACIFCCGFFCTQSTDRPGHHRMQYLSAIPHLPFHTAHRRCSPIVQRQRLRTSSLLSEIDVEIQNSKLNSSLNIRLLCAVGLNFQMRWSDSPAQRSFSVWLNHMIVQLFVNSYSRLLCNTFTSWILNFCFKDHDIHIFDSHAITEPNFYIKFSEYLK